MMTIQKCLNLNCAVWRSFFDIRPFNQYFLDTLFFINKKLKVTESFFKLKHFFDFIKKINPQYIFIEPIRKIHGIKFRTEEFYTKNRNLHSQMLFKMTIEILKPRFDLFFVLKAYINIKFDSKYSYSAIFLTQHNEF